MLVTRTVEEFTGALAAARAAGSTIGLVPTMGALHDGHRSLVARAGEQNDVVAVTIFVNPLQFGDPLDIAHYPRPIERDLEVCAGAGVGVVFVPPVDELYPDHPRAPAVTVSVGAGADCWEGASRPGHFDGVATVVTKIFAMAAPCRAYFGEKDWQQLALVRRLPRDLMLEVEVVGCPTVREADGLALSSRNVRLGVEERRAATVLRRALDAGQAALAEGGHDPVSVRRAMEVVFGAEPLATLDYAAVVRADDLTEPVTLVDPPPLRLLVAAQVGPVRLIDNCEGVAVAAPCRGAAPSHGAAPMRGKDLVTCDAG